LSASQFNVNREGYGGGTILNIDTAGNLSGPSSVSATEIYTTGGWFRNHTNNNGIYWSNTGWHIYPNSASDLNIRSGADGGTLRCMRADGTTYGYVHWASDRAMGFLTDGGSWRFRVDNSNNVSYVSSLTMSGYLYINRGDPTIYLQDTNHRSSMIHCNSNIFYILRGDGTNSTAWATYNGYWPMEINLENNYATFGGGATFVYNVTAADFVLSSDVRLKTNLVPLTSAIDAVDTLTAYRYTHTKTERQEVGVLAQEVREVLPEAVTEGEDGMLGVSYDRLVPLLLAAVKEMSARIKTLEQTQ
jgi:hypothetical protein